MRVLDLMQILDNRMSVVVEYEISTERFADAGKIREEYWEMMVKSLSIAGKEFYIKVV